VQRLPRKIITHSSDSYEHQQIKKDRTILTNDYYRSPQTSLLIFHFEPNDFKSSNRIKTCLINHASIENKDLYTFDGFFSKDEQNELRGFFGKATYGRTSYGSHDSIEKGEKPAYSMNTKERWNLFSSPPQSIQELHKLLSFFAYHLDAEITTLPWELCHQTAGSPSVLPSVIVNFHNEGISKESVLLGMHQDCKPEKGIFFGIPILYNKNTEYHESHFVNGAPGKPWLVSMMLYSFSEEFLPEYLMGTVFYKADRELALKVNCQDARFVLFEGDIFHSPEESNIPTGIKPWRVSYVLKLIINPKNENQCVKKMFSELLHNWSSQIHELTLGINSRA
jgi:hypothetical protein